MHKGRINDECRAMSRDHKITVVSSVILLLITVGYSVLDLYVWIALVLSFGFILLTMLSKAG